MPNAAQQSVDAQTGQDCATKPTAARSSTKPTWRAPVRPGRPEGGYAFRHLERPNDGPPTRLWDVTEAEMLDMESQISHGVASAHRVVSSVLGVQNQTYWIWMTHGEQEDCSNQIKRAFYLRIWKAICECRGIAEQRFFEKDPGAWLRGPAGRSRGKDDPGWTDETITRHTDHTGDGDPRYVLEVTSTGFQAHKVGAEQPALGAGDEEEK